MSKKIPNRENLIGHWILQDKKIIADANCVKARDLVEKYLLEIGRSQDGWDILLKDPEDGFLWEAVYLESHMHGGGPISLLMISEVEAKIKYRI